jgi:threonine/homoserine/homoserine lactone efflux protein
MSHILAFAAVAMVLIAVPGPSVLFTVSRALTVGRRSALFTVIGNEIGEFAQVAAVAFGVGALVERSAEIFAIVKWAGAAYLVFLGVQAIRHRRSMTEKLAARTAPVRPLRAIGGLFASIALLLDSAWAAVAGTARQWLVRSPRRLALIGGTSGLVMIGLGVSIAATGRSD